MVKRIYGRAFRGLRCVLRTTTFRQDCENCRRARACTCLRPDTVGQCTFCPTGKHGSQLNGGITTSFRSRRRHPGWQSKHANHVWRCVNACPIGSNDASSHKWSPDSDAQFARRSHRWDVHTNNRFSRDFAANHSARSEGAIGLLHTEPFHGQRRHCQRRDPRCFQ
jgi:hypothetical protein